MTPVQNPTKEMDSKCQGVIRDAMQWCGEVAGHAPGNACLFEDALHLIPHGHLDTAWPYSSRLQSVKNAPLATRAHCVQHQHPCCLAKNHCLAVSGLPCPDMSTAGLMRKRAGETSNVYLAHGKYCTKHRTPLMLIECTPESLALPFIASFLWYALI